MRVSAQAFKQLVTDLEKAATVAFAVALQDTCETQLAWLSHLLHPWLASLVVCAVVTLLFAWVRMMLDTAPANREKFAVFLRTLLQTVLGWMLGPGLAASLNGPAAQFATELGLSGFCACAMAHLTVFLLWTFLGCASAQLPSAAPGKRAIWYSCPPATYGLHLSALLRGAIPLTVAATCNVLKNDLLTLGPLPYTPSLSAPFLILATHVVILLILGAAKMALVSDGVDPTPLQQRHDFLATFSIHFLEGLLLFNALQMFWSSVIVSTCTPSTLAPLIPLSSGLGNAIRPILVGVGLVGLSCFKATLGTRATPATLGGFKLPAVSLGILWSALAVSLGLTFKVSFIMLTHALLPSVSTHTANAALVLLLLAVVAVLSTLDFVLPAVRSLIKPSDVGGLANPLLA